MIPTFTLRTLIAKQIFNRGDLAENMALKLASNGHFSPETTSQNYDPPSGSWYAPINISGIQRNGHKIFLNLSSPGWVVRGQPTSIKAIYIDGDVKTKDKTEKLLLAYKLLNTTVNPGEEIEIANGRVVISLADNNPQ